MQFVTYNNDGSRIVSAGRDGKSYIWNPNNGAILDSVNTIGSSLWSAKFSPDGENVLVAGTSGRARIWNISTRQVVRDFDTKHFVVVYADYNPSGDKIVTADWFGEAIVWDVETGDKLFSVAHGTTEEGKPLNSASFSFNGDILLTAAVDNTARMWNAHNGDSIAVLLEHRASVQTAFFNFDGSRIITSSFDSTAKVWNLDKRDLQMDTTSCHFAIQRAQILAKDVDFGRVSIDMVADTTINVFIQNLTDYKFRIYDIKIVGEYAEEYSILNGFAPYIIDSAEAREIELSFSPRDIGFRPARIEISYPANILSIDLNGEGYEPGIQLTTNLVDFHQVEVGDFKDTVITAVLKNRTLNPVSITSIENSGLDFIHFDIISGNEPLILRSGEEYPMTFRFTPETIGRKNSIVTFEFNSFGSPLKLLLFGEGVQPNLDTITIEIPDISGKPGEIVELPIFAKTHGAFPASLNGITMDLSFNATLLEPVNAQYPSIINNNIRTITLNINTDFSSEIIGKVYFRIGLGNDSVSAIKVENSHPIGSSKVRINEVDGMFTLLGICNQGGPRLFDPNGKFVLEQNVPNPFSNSTKISFEVLETGQAEIYLIDVLGQKVETILSQNMTRGLYSIIFDGSHLAPGVYYYVLQTASQKKTKRMDIHR